MSIDDKIDKEFREKIDKFEHQFNPEHFYCRLREIGFNKFEASRYVYLYKPLYNEVIKYVKEERYT